MKKMFKRIFGFSTKTSTTKNFMKYVENNGILLNWFNVDCRFPLFDKKYIHVGNNTMVDATFIFETKTGEVNLQANSFIGRSTFICRSKIDVGSNVFIAWGCYFYDHDSHSLNYLERRKDIQQQLSDYKAGRNFIENKNWNVVNTKPIKICNDAWIGMNVIILKGVTIGEGAIVAAGSVVSKNVEPWTVYAGNPARKIKDIEH